MAEEWLTVAEAAERLKLSEETVRIWLRAGRMRGTRPGGKKAGWRIPESEIQRVLEDGASAGSAA